jgi:hypothetical protein
LNHGVIPQREQQQGHVSRPEFAVGDESLDQGPRREAHGRQVGKTVHLAVAVHVELVDLPPGLATHEEVHVRFGLGERLEAVNARAKLAVLGIGEVEDPSPRVPECRLRWSGKGKEARVMRCGAVMSSRRHMVLLESH